MLTWPNRITLLRILFLPVFIIGVLHARERIWLQSLLPVIFALMALGDYLDGYLARKLGQHSELGAFVDPLADKFTMSSAAILLAIPAVTQEWLAFPIPSWIVVLLIARDLLILVGYLVLYLKWGIHTVQPSPMGKITTAAQMALVLLTLLSGTSLGNLVASRAALWVFRTLWVLVGVCTVVSWCDYLTRFNRVLVEKSQTHSTE